MRKILAVASSCNRKTKLMSLKEVFDRYDFAFVPTMEMYRSEVVSNRFYLIRGASQLNKCSIAVSIVKLLFMAHGQSAVRVYLDCQKHSEAK